jgi:hypothetical protein
MIANSGRDLPQASPPLQLLLGRDSGSGGMAIAPFIPPLHVTTAPMLLVQPLSCLPLTSTSVW